ncbi:MAG: DUF4926 domain-containing protein [Litorilinea sp.]
MIKEHDRVVLTVDLPEHKLYAGDVGVVVMIHGADQGYELEIIAVDGHTLDVITVDATQVRPVTEREIVHARML